MTILIKNGRVLTLGTTDHEYDRADVLIEGSKIKKIGKDLDIEGQVDEVIDASGMLVMPGLVNCHCHSDENFMRGRLEGMPLEPWMVYSLPLLNYGPFPERWIYLRTMLGIIDMVKSGVTTVQDDCSEIPSFTFDGYGAAMKAYQDSGLRACLMANVSNKKESDKLQSLKEILPRPILEKLDESDKPSVPEIIDTYRQVYTKWHDQDNGRLRVSVSCSCPQRCSDEYLMELGELSYEWNVPFNMHIVETKTQVLTGSIFYGKSILKHVADLGLLSPRTNVIHSVWMDDEDIEIMGANGVSVSHNPVSNCKLGSGIMPLRKILNAGINVGLGTDGMSSNDAQNIFEAMKVMLLLQQVSSPDYYQWPTASEALRLATFGGARACLLHDQIGALEAGRSADIILIDLHSPAFVPLNDIKRQLVYCENGSSVVTSIIHGKIVMEHGKLGMVDEKDIYSEVEELIPEFHQIYLNALNFSKQITPYYEQVYWRSVRKAVGFNRWGGEENEWIRSNG